MWLKDGYKIEVEFFLLEKPLDIDKYRTELIPLLPSYNAPINRVGGSQTGYLFNINKDVSDFLFDKIKLNMSDERFYSLYSDIFGYVDDAENEIIVKLSNIKIDDKPVVDIEYIAKDKKELVAGKDKKPSYPRDIKVAINALKIAEHKCEYDDSHYTFTRKKDGKPYTEPHHLIPLSRHKDFKNSLDVEANIISLCSHCHNLIHYGSNFEEVLKILFDKRKDLLNQVGLSVSFSDLKEYYK